MIFTNHFLKHWRPWKIKLKKSYAISAGTKWRSDSAGLENIWLVQIIPIVKTLNLLKNFLKIQKNLSTPAKLVLSVTIVPFIAMANSAGLSDVKNILTAIIFRILLWEFLVQNAKRDKLLNEDPRGTRRFSAVRNIPIVILFHGINR